jgi:hypothetical protein
MSMGLLARTRFFIALVVVGCAHYTEHAAAGEVALDSLPVAPIAWLQLQNGSTSGVRVYTVVGGEERYVGHVSGTHLRRFPIDPARYRAADVQIVIRRSTDSTTKIFEPLRLRSGETIDVVIRTKLDRSALSVRRG